MAEESEMDFFTALVAKQAEREMRNLNSLPVSDVQKGKIGALIQEIKERGSEMTPLDLVKYQDLGIPIEAVLFAGFLKGVAMPELDLAEARTEAIGGLGVCLFVDDQPFAFYDADGTVYLPGDKRVQELATAGTRFLVVVSMCLKEASQWEGCHGTRDGDRAIVEMEGAWCGKPAENAHAQFVRCAFGDAKIVFDDAKKLDTVRFEIEMRKSMGIQ